MISREVETVYTDYEPIFDDNGNQIGNNPVRKTKKELVIDSLPKDGSKKRNRYHHGPIAQEVKQLIDETGVDFGGFQDHSHNGGSDVYSIGYSELIAPLIKAVQELSAEVESLRAQING